METNIREDPSRRQDYFEGKEEDYNNKDGYSTLNRPSYLEGNLFWKKIIFKKLLSLVKTKDNILEVGCAGGYHSKLLAKEFNNVLGIDFAKSRIDYAKKYETDKLKFKQVDVTCKSSIKSIDRKFDTLYSSFVLHHIPLPKKIDAFNNLSLLGEDNADLFLFDGFSQSKDNIDDRFVGLFNDKWIKENIPSWELISCNLIFRFVTNVQFMEGVDKLDLTEKLLRRGYKNTFCRKDRYRIILRDDNHEVNEYYDIDPIIVDKSLIHSRQNEYHKALEISQTNCSYHKALEIVNKEYPDIRNQPKKLVKLAQMNSLWVYHPSEDVYCYQLKRK